MQQGAEFALKVDAERKERSGQVDDMSKAVESAKQQMMSEGERHEKQVADLTSKVSGLESEMKEGFAKAAEAEALAVAKEEAHRAQSAKRPSGVTAAEVKVMISEEKGEVLAAVASERKDREEDGSKMSERVRGVEEKCERESATLSQAVGAAAKTAKA